MTLHHDDVDYTRRQINLYRMFFADFLRHYSMIIPPPPYMLTVHTQFHENRLRID